MDVYTYDMYDKLEPEVAKIAYHEMMLTPEQFSQEDVGNITYELCKSPQDRHLNFWGYVSVIHQMDGNADWPAVRKGIQQAIHQYLKQ